MIHNFNAGPSILPPTVLEEASKAILNFNNSGLSILEIGHRTPLFESVMNEAISLVKELMNLDDDHEVLFMHGGATVQFMEVPMNLLNENETGAYADTGVWSTKAIKEAKLFGNVDVVCSSKDHNYNYIPKDFAIPANASYFHITTNNTIYGTQWHEIPKVNMPLIADMSSDILSRKMDFNSFGLIFAGAQKNMGAAGTNLVVVNKNILGKVKRPIPAIMDYRNHIEAKSMLNTPPVFAIYVSMLTLRWLRENGGVEAMEQLNAQKATILYNAIDNSKIFKPTAAKEDRSSMNVCFVMEDAEKEKAFLDFAKQNNIYGIKGHRSVGGFRASLYNALPLKSVEYLVEKMEEFEKGI
jgi:phosphoserine aminotransferase